MTSAGLARSRGGLQYVDGHRDGAGRLAQFAHLVFMEARPWAFLVVAVVRSRLDQAVVTIDLDVGADSAGPGQPHPLLAAAYEDGGVQHDVRR